MAVTLPAAIMFAAALTALAETAAHAQQNACLAHSGRCAGSLVDADPAAAPQSFTGDQLLIQQGARIRRSQDVGLAAIQTVRVSCTAEDVDPYGSGVWVECCQGLAKKNGQWAGARWYYLCKPQAGAVPTAIQPAAGGGSGSGSPAGAIGTSSGVGTLSATTNLLLWNVHYANKDTDGLAAVIAENAPDVVGICELTVDVGAMAASLRVATGSDFQAQPGRGGWTGYGTDIFYDAGRWEALDGGVAKAECPDSRGGPRATNWAVLRERASGRSFITGGIHLSYCSDGCDSLHACELTELYRRLQAMRDKYPSAPVTWMGDTNLAVHSGVMRGLLEHGSTGEMSTFKVDDLAQTQGNTYFSGGSAIDHILGEHGAFSLQGGGRTGQGVTGQHLNGADHFPVYAKVSWPAAN